MIRGFPVKFVRYTISCGLEEELHAAEDLRCILVICQLFALEIDGLSLNILDELSSVP